MSRFRKFAHSLASGYLLIGANTLYLLVSIPLALHYLSREEFDLWALISQLATYLAMLDLGMGSSVARILIDLKDDRHSGRYGSAIKTGLLVGAVQGAIVLALGAILVLFLADWLQVSAPLRTDFTHLLAGQVLMAAFGFVARIFGQILYAWQRLDVQNYAQIVQIAATLGIQWVGFSLHWGILSLLAGQVAGWLLVNLICAVACQWLHLLPGPGEWGRNRWQQFRELFSYASDIFLIALGTQIITESQAILVTRVLGMDAMAVWAVMTKTFGLASQVIFRVVGTTMPALGEMQSRGEGIRLWERYRGIFMTTNLLAVIGAAVLMACNGPFVLVWTQGRMSWPLVNDVILGLWLIVMAQQCCHNSLIMCLKEIRELKYTYLIEGVAFIVSASWLMSRYGVTGMLGASLGCTLVFTWANGTWRVARLIKNQNQPPLWRWLVPSAFVLAALLLLWLGADMLLRPTPLLLRLVLNALLLGAAGLWLSFRFALPRNLRAELIDRLPPPLRRMATVLMS